MSVFASAGMGATFLGPGGVLIPLGVELLVHDLTKVTMIYNYFALTTLAIITWSAGQKDVKFMGIITPLWAALCMFAGWLHFPNQAQGFGILVVVVAIGLIAYFHETQHERFGIAGPGNKIVKIFMGLIILQCVVVFVNTGHIFPDSIPTVAASNNQYANIDLTQQISSLNGTGGLFAKIVDIVTIGAQIAYSALYVFCECLLSIGLFAYVAWQVFPWFSMAGDIGVGFLIVMQFAIWLMYVIFVLALFYRPGPDPGW
jgi:hypothetical protein